MFNLAGPSAAHVSHLIFCHGGQGRQPGRYGFATSFRKKGGGAGPAQRRPRQ